VLTGQIIVARVKLDSPIPAGHTVSARVRVGEWSLVQWLTAPLRRRGLLT